MKIEAYIITWNREDLIHLTINHYKQYCEKVVIFDNFSTDNTRGVARNLGCDVRMFGKSGELNDSHYLDVKNNCWKGSDADWVIVCDDDEILYHPDLMDKLYRARAEGVTVFRPQGYNMHSNDVPRESWLDIKTGLKNDNYSKWVIFSPKIKEIGYVYGCHEARPKGDIKFRDEFMLLHYRDIGGVDKLIKRHKEYVDRLSAINKKWNLGSHYLQDENQKRSEYRDNLKIALNNGPIF